MSAYSLLRPLLFQMDAERAHGLALGLLALSARLRMSALFSPRVEDLPVEIMGLTFPNPVGLAAGLDKNGDYFNALGQLGFGFIEIGTVTPRPQGGNPKPRLFRLAEHEAIINRMGFNNLGIEHLLEQVAKRRFQGVLGINIGKNFDTPVEKANDDYRLGLRQAYPFADYITVNVSSPNTPGLRSLQLGDNLKELLEMVKQEQAQLQQQHQKRVPIAVKIAPDLNAEEIATVAQQLLAFDIDGVISTNTTITRDGVGDHPLAVEQGGLSGAPLREQATTVVAQLNQALAGKLPIIAVGGITRGEHALEKLKAGASLVQIYSGFIYRGPALVGECVESLRTAMNS